MKNYNKFLGRENVKEKDADVGTDDVIPDFGEAVNLATESEEVKEENSQKQVETTGVEDVKETTSKDMTYMLVDCGSSMYVRVTASYLNLREEPTPQSKSKEILKKDQKLKVIKKLLMVDGTSWYQVDSPNNTGYVNADFII